MKIDRTAMQSLQTEMFTHCQANLQLHLESPLSVQLDERSLDMDSMTILVFSQGRQSISKLHSFITSSFVWLY